MIRSRLVAASVLGLVVSTSAIQGQSASHYRDFRLGDSLPSISALAGTPASNAKTMHTRPALVQNLEWRRTYTGASETAIDPVQQISFSFYNDQLFRIVVDYDRDRTRGMIDTDMIAAISTMYGATIKSASKATFAGAEPSDEASGTRVAGWGGAEYLAVLYRFTYASGYRLIVTSVQLAALARQADVQAERHDELEAPRRERDKQKKEADDERASQERARIANKAAFTP